MSDAVTPEFVRVPGLTGLVSAFRNYAETAAAGTLPDGTPPAAGDERTADQRVAETYAHCASLLTMHVDRLLEQDLDRLNAPDLRARLAIVEADLGRTRERAGMAEHRVTDVMRAALGLGDDTEPEVLSDLTVAGIIAERQRWRDDYDGAVALVAKMHAAAMGGVVRGPVHGVVEDVWWLRAALDRLAVNAEEFLDIEPHEVAFGERRERLSSALLDARRILQPADAEEHRDPIDVVNAIADVLTMRGVLHRIAVELEALPRLSAADRKIKRTFLASMAREFAGAPPYPEVETRVEILLTLMHDAWGVIANAGLHRGNWDHEHPEWVAAAERWRDRFHTMCGLDQLFAAGVDLAVDRPPLPDPSPFTNAPELVDQAADLLAELEYGHTDELAQRAGAMALALKMKQADPSTNACESDAAAARRFATELERLRSGLHRLGITEGNGPWNVPVDEWPVTTALAAIDAAKQDIERNGPRVTFEPGLAVQAGDPVPEVKVDLDELAVLPELVEHADDPAAEPNDALTRDMSRVAAGFTGVAYDPYDRPVEILALRRAALRAGLTPFPSEDLAPPRGYRGATPPAPPKAKLATTAAAVVTNTTEGPLVLIGTGNAAHQAVTLLPGDSLTVTALPASTT